MKGFSSVFLALCLAGCFSLPQDPAYKGPAARPPELTAYYSRDGIQVESVNEEVLRTEDEYTVRRFVLDSAAGKSTVDYYRRRQAGDQLILVFPVLGGKKNLPENYFAQHFAENGFDAAIIHRDEDIKKPENFIRFEELMRANVIRDRLVMDFFEQRFGKRRFGAFGISRGAINVATTAGVDERLKHTVMLLGGSDLIGVFKRTDQKRIRFLVDKISADRHMTVEQLLEHLRDTIKTDPKYLARHVDSRETLLILGLFDQTVPVKYGFRLRSLLGHPETIVLLSGHYTSVAYTHLPTILPGGEILSLLPTDYVESESLRFFRGAFERPRSALELVPMRMLRAPFDIIGRVVSYFWLDDDAVPEEPEIPWREEPAGAAGNPPG